MLRTEGTFSNALFERFKDRSEVLEKDTSTNRLLERFNVVKECEGNVLRSFNPLKLKSKNSKFGRSDVDSNSRVVNRFLDRFRDINCDECVCVNERVDREMIGRTYGTG